MFTIFSPQTVSAAQEAKRIRAEHPHDDGGGGGGSEDPNATWTHADSGPSSPHSDNSPDDVADGHYLDVEGESSITSSEYTFYSNHIWVNYLPKVVNNSYLHFYAHCLFVIYIIKSTKILIKYPKIVIFS